MSDYTYRMTISGSGKGLASPIISKVSHFPAARLAIIIGGVRSIAMYQSRKETAVCCMWSTG